MSTEPLDPYWQWLGIPAEEQPPSHYRLLGLRHLESDRDLIGAAADQRLALIEAQRGGVEESHCDHLLAEIAAARDCLLDAAAKASYDAALTQAMPMAVSMLAEPPHPPHVEPIPPPVVEPPVAEPWDGQADEPDEEQPPAPAPWTWRGWALVIFATTQTIIASFVSLLTVMATCNLAILTAQGSTDKSGEVAEPVAGDAFAPPAAASQD